jgi:3,2-trans-enoyl-CoA isomerase
LTLRRVGVSAKEARMECVALEKGRGVATLTLGRGKVNALNGLMVDELRAALRALEGEPEVRAIVLTGAGKFFSFGFDVPEFLSFTEEQFADYLTNFTELYTYLFMYPKPVVAALNGHAVAGGCMLALACDYRVMVGGRAKIGLNEINFGSTVFAGSTEMLRFWVGGANAAAVLYSGAMYSAEEAERIGLVHEVAGEENLPAAARRAASELASKHPPAFASIKSLLRKSIAEEMRRGEAESVKGVVEIWYSEATRAKLREIKIHQP